ncbi:MAG: GrpB family protein [Cyanobacteria bacterium J06633_2]
MRRVEVLPYNPVWQERFREESGHIRHVLSKNITEIHHIDSTSIPNIWAKPIIDIMVEVVEIHEVDQQQSSMEALNYEALGEYGIAGRRYFRKHNQEGIRTHHVHMFQVGSGQIERHLAFRDYMIAHPKDAQAYSDLKQELARAHPTDIEAYMDGKHEFITTMDKRAAQWRKDHSTTIL